MNPADIASALRAARRQRVSELLAKGMTSYQIAMEMEADDQYRNPDTGRPWCVDTIKSDMQSIRKRWRQEALLNYDIHVSRILGQLRQVRLSAWKSMDLNTILKTLDQEVKLLGLDKATKSEIDWREEMRKAGVDPASQFESLVQAAYENMLMEGDNK